jgi:DNA-binding CsgD family transcriptional regulator/GAF domain-containing protein
MQWHATPFPERNAARELTHHLAHLSAAVHTPIWLMSEQGENLAVPAVATPPCCRLSGERLPECIAFRQAVAREVAASACVCTPQCPHGHSFLAVRLPPGGSIGGAVMLGGYAAEELAVETPEAHPLSIAEQSLLVSLLPGLAPTLKELATEQAVVRRLEECARLFSGSPPPAGASGWLESLLDQAVSMAALSPEAEVAIFADTGSGRARILSGHGPQMGSRKGHEWPLGLNMVSWVVRTGQELLIPDAGADPRTRQACRADSLSCRAWFAAPVQVEGHLSGALTVGFPVPGLPPRSELNLYRTLAAFIGHAWTASRLRQRLGEYAESLAALDPFFTDGWRMADAPEFLVGLLRSHFDLEAVEVQEGRAAPAPPPGSGEHREVRISLPRSQKVVRLIPGARSGGLQSDPTFRTWLFTLDAALAMAGAREGVDARVPGRADSATAARFGLTAREIEILDLMARGHSNREIAAALFVSEATVKTHVSRILRKMGVDRRSRALRIYLESR